MFVFALSLLFLSVAVALVLYARWNFGKLKNCGFPVMEPSFILGSSPRLHTKVQHFEDMARFKKYGPVWGYFQGRMPIVFIADPDLIRKIFVSDSSHFESREQLEFGDAVLNQILDFLSGEKWKKMRASQSKFFSHGKLTQYSNEIFRTSIQKFKAKVEREIAETSEKKLRMDTRERFCTYSIDAIARSLFSMDVNTSNEDPFYRACKKLIGAGQKITQLHVWTFTFPCLTRFAPTLVLDKAMTDTLLELVRSRGNSGITCGDYGDVVVDCFRKLSTPEYKNLGITDKTILGQAVNLFLAGFDRISSTMTFLAYHLAKEPQVQEKLHSEVSRVISEMNGDEVGHNEIQQMPFLNACVLEVSRLYSIFLRPERVCNKEWVDPERGIRIRKGVAVMIASWAVNRNAEFYSNPDEFLPERFMPENKGSLNAYAFTSFGFGHRNCMGMKFAYVAVKTALANLILEYKFQLREDTHLKFKPGLNYILQFEPLYLDIVKR